MTNVGRIHSIVATLVSDSNGGVSECSDRGWQPEPKSRAPALTMLAVGMIAALGSACASWQDYGPLAVYRADAGTEDIGHGGILRINDDCVTLETEDWESDGTREFVVWWPDRYTEWDAEAEQIHVENRGRSVTLSDGDEIRFTGSPLPDPDPDRLVHEPDEACPEEVMLVAEPPRLDG